MSHCRCGSCASCGGWCGVRCAPGPAYNGIPVLIPEEEPAPVVSDATQFGAFLALLDQAISSESFVAANTMLQDPVQLEQQRARVRALSPNFVCSYTMADVAVSSPLTVTVDAQAQALRFRGTNYPRVIALPDTTAYRPSFVVIRTPTLEVPEPTILIDQSTGVWLLNVQGVPTRRLPGWNEGDIDSGYGSATSACFWVGPGDVPVLALVMPTHHVIRLFDLRDGTTLSTIGAWNGPGDDPPLLHTPVSCTYRQGVLYIACQEGTPTSLVDGPITAQPGGYLCSFGVSTPASPVPLGVLAAHTTDGSLLHGEVHDPRGLWVDGDTLWATNGSPAEAASWPLPLPASTSLPHVPTTRYFSASSFTEAVWSNLGAPCVRHLTNNPTVLIVPDRGTGLIFTVRLDRNEIRALYRTRWTRDEFTSPDALAPTGMPSCAIADRRVVGGILQDVLWVCDTQQGIVMNIPDNQDTTYYPSRVLYHSRSFAVPARVLGYAVTGTMPTDRFRVSVKSSLSAQWRDLNPVDCTEPFSELIVRVTVDLPYGDVGNGYVLRSLRLLLETV